MESKGGRLGVSRLKREECKRTKHDSVFSKWKILIGPSDWENFSLGKEGTERYRTHNLPVSCSCSGLYELGISTSLTGFDDHGGDGREGGERRSLRGLDPDGIIVAYLGQADNVRTRLQHYGRAGSHLGHGNWVGRFDQEEKVPCFASGGPGLFQEIFSRGFPIVFRWASMENKKEAERTEALLLGVFDYAWNKGGNGPRRPNDILVKLDRIISKTTILPNIARKLQEWKRHHPFPQKQMGIRIKDSPSPASDAESIICSDEKPNNLLSWVCKFGRSQPQILKQECSDEDDHGSICGVALGDGSVCRNKPVEGRKRCGQHKGKRINGSISESVTKGKLQIHGAGLDGGSICVEVPVLDRSKTRGDSKLENLPSQVFKLERLQPPLMMEKYSLNEDCTLCGVILGDGSVCRAKPVKGRKRCEQHKGKRMSTSISKSLLKGNDLGLEIGSGDMETSLYGSKISTSGDWELDKLCPQVVKHDRLRPQLVTGRCVSVENYTICGVALGDGSVCNNKPVQGRKRCAEHKGKRTSK
ncbi:protein EFFECTOR OF TRANSCRIPTION 2-like [Macadamia integrifolia]|uniref:protein EFFECTOR OF TRANSCRIPTION 2-like n=1 Tax=Macadamia integrifolia TaxID=60698 RepID=UPI001C5001D7|nr:protein EFFECTOR OF TRANSCRIPTION 2-like [Macadamia integrifolia]